MPTFDTYQLIVVDGPGPSGDSPPPPVGYALIERYDDGRIEAVIYRHLRDPEPKTHGAQNWKEAHAWLREQIDKQFGESTQLAQQGH